MIKSHPSASTEQCEAEQSVRALLETKLGCVLGKKRFPIAEGSVEVDAVCESPRVLAEICARTGILKPGQIKKVHSDLLKLVFIEKATGQSWRKILAFCDPQAASWFEGSSWGAQAAREFKVEIQVLDLPEEMRIALETARIRQKMGNV